jgi:hypothetical protein
MLVAACLCTVHRRSLGPGSAVSGWAVQKLDSHRGGDSLFMPSWVGGGCGVCIYIPWWFSQRGHSQSPSDLFSQSDCRRSFLCLIFFICCPIEDRHSFLCAVRGYSIHVPSPGFQSLIATQTKLYALYLYYYYSVITWSFRHEILRYARPSGRIGVVCCC